MRRQVVVVLVVVLPFTSGLWLRSRGCSGMRRTGIGLRLGVELWLLGCSCSDCLPLVVMVVVVMVVLLFALIMFFLIRRIWARMRRRSS